MSGIDTFKKKAKLSIDEMYEHQPVGFLETQNKNKPENQESIEAEPLALKQDSLEIQNISSFSSKQQQKVLSYKMTFNLTEDAYHIFERLFAERMLQGRKIGKSELICEAIDCLAKLEKS
jgi:hypothetical protein